MPVTNPLRKFAIEGSIYCIIKNIVPPPTLNLNYFEYHLFLTPYWSPMAVSCSSQPRPQRHLGKLLGCKLLWKGICPHMRIPLEHHTGLVENVLPGMTHPSLATPRAPVKKKASILSRLSLTYSFWENDRATRPARPFWQPWPCCRDPPWWDDPLR